MTDLSAALTRRHISRRRFIEQAGALGVTATSLTALLGACSPNAPSQRAAGAGTAPAAGGAPPASGSTKTLTVAVEADISSLRPDRFGPFMDRYANRTLYDVLLHYKTKQ